MLRLKMDMKLSFISFGMLRMLLVFVFYSLELGAQTDTLYHAEGIASFYAKKFHGRQTASGEIFHVDSLTAAHKFLPFGTLVRVTNLSNGKEVYVRINDRGMKGLKRIIDLSPAAARELNMLNHGVARVRVEEIPEGFPSENGLQIPIPVPTDTVH